MSNRYSSIVNKITTQLTAKYDSPSQDSPSNHSPSNHSPSQDPSRQDSPSQDPSRQDPSGQDSPSQDSPNRGSPRRSLKVINDTNFEQYMNEVPLLNLLFNNVKKKEQDSYLTRWQWDCEAWLVNHQETKDNDILNNLEDIISYLPKLKIGTSPIKVSGAERGNFTPDEASYKIWVIDFSFEIAEEIDFEELFNPPKTLRVNQNVHSN